MKRLIATIITILFLFASPAEAGTVHSAFKSAGSGNDCSHTHRHTRTSVNEWSIEVKFSGQGCNGGQFDIRTQGKISGVWYEWVSSNVSVYNGYVYRVTSNQPYTDNKVRLHDDDVTGWSGCYPSCTGFYQYH